MSDRKTIVPLGNGAPIKAARESVSFTLTGGGVSFSAITKADIIFVIDTTGSMDSEIHGLLQMSQRFVDELAGKRIDWQIAVVSFGDLTVPGDKIEATPFSGDPEAVKASLRHIPRNDGGGNDGESCLEAVIKALNLPGYREDSIRVLILMTDEPALQSAQLNPPSVLETLRSNGVLTFVISEPFGYFEAMAKGTGGEWFQISADTDFLSVLSLLTRKVAVVVSDVQKLAAGDVHQYLQLKAGG